MGKRKEKTKEKENESRQRAKNFTEDEKSILKKLICQEQIVLSKKTDGPSMALKEAGWQRIINTFNKIPGCHKRDVRQLKKAWDNIRTSFKADITAAKQEAMATGGGKIATVMDEDPDMELLKGTVDVEIRNSMDNDRVWLMRGIRQGSKPQSPSVAIPSTSSTSIQSVQNGQGITLQKVAQKPAVVSKSNVIVLPQSQPVRNVQSPVHSLPHSQPVRNVQSPVHSLPHSQPVHNAQSQVNPLYDENDAEEVIVNVDAVDGINNIQNYLIEDEYDNSDNEDDPGHRDSTTPQSSPLSPGNVTRTNFEAVKTKISKRDAESIASHKLKQKLMTEEHKLRMDGLKLLLDEKKEALQAKKEAANAKKEYYLSVAALKFQKYAVSRRIVFSCEY